MRSKFTARLVKGTHLWELSVYEAGNKVGWYRRYPAQWESPAREALVSEIEAELRGLAGSTITYHRARGTDAEFLESCVLQG